MIILTTFIKTAYSVWILVQNGYYDKNSTEERR